MTNAMVPLIQRKRQGGELDPEELAFICDGVVHGTIPDYQVAAWLMAVCLRGMTTAETLALTLAMVRSGATLDWRGLDRQPVDKHSTGGVGDKTSLVLVPLMAAAGLPFVKMAGRGLGHTGGTLDKLESIPGFRVELSLEALQDQVRRVGCALVGQSPKLVPADGKLYALRDVTGTVESIPLIASSIMSKKLAAGASAINLDVKYGSGAFMASVEEARELATAMVRIGTGAGRKVRALLSPMEEPLGHAVGNALEVREAIDTLHGRGPADLWELVLQLGAQLLLLTGDARDAQEARETLTAVRDSGAAARRLEQLISAQGGDAAVVEDPSILPSAPVVLELHSAEAGWVAALHARVVADVALELGAGRRTKADTIDHSVGIVVRARVGERVEEGARLAEIHASSREAAERAVERLRRDAYTLSTEPTEAAHPDPEIIESSEDAGRPVTHGSTREER
jgi:pyrimidine-nucleoside phosphorylase